MSQFVDSIKEKCIQIKKSAEKWYDEELPEVTKQASAVAKKALLLLTSLVLYHANPSLVMISLFVGITNTFSVKDKIYRIEQVAIGNVAGQRAT